MEDTISAIATASGEGGIGIVRISGDQAKSILEKIFMPVSKFHSQNKDEDLFLNNIINNNEEFSISNKRYKKMVLPEAEGETIGLPIVNRRLNYGFIIDPDTEQVIDEVMAVYMNAPHTYTVEDIVEIQCHGSIVALKNILELTLRMGARLAEKGEFTKRAFLNGRLDLSQAGAVIDLIKAKTDKSFQVAFSQMKGGLSNKVDEIRIDLMDVLVQIAVNLDYPDEDIEELTYEKMEQQLHMIEDKIKKLIASSDTGRMLRDGFAVAIIGKPNVGKSSLMNAFLKESRAIVTEIPGTTRDVIEESMSIRGIPVKLIDTAGIRETEDKIEKIGIEKSKEAFNKADLVLFMMDSSRELSVEDREIADYIDAKKTVVLLNKSDLEAGFGENDIQRLIPDVKMIRTSMMDEAGLSELEDHIEFMVYGGSVQKQESDWVTDVRHKDMLIQAEKSIKDAIDMTKQRQAMDFVEVDIRNSWELLGSIIGETVSEDIIEEVFSRFCLGK